MSILWLQNPCPLINPIYGKVRHSNPLWFSVPLCGDPHKADVRTSELPPFLSLKILCLVLALAAV
jgi:hypothetical protein